MQRIRPITCAQTALFTEKSSNDAISDPLHIPLPGIGIPTKKSSPINSYFFTIALFIATLSSIAFPRKAVV